jgi:hypothetical protein
MTRAKDKTFICQRCNLEIYGPELKHLVRLSSGSMHGACHKAHREYVDSTIAAALANGTHAVRDQSHPTVAEIYQRIEREHLERQARRNPAHQPTGV